MISFGTKPIWVTFQFGEGFSIKIQVSLCSSIIKFLGKISIIYKSFAFVIKVVDKIINLPIL